MLLVLGGCALLPPVAEAQGLIIGYISDAFPADIQIQIQQTDGTWLSVGVGASIEGGTTLSITQWCGSPPYRGAGHVEVRTRQGPPVHLYCGASSDHAFPASDIQPRGRTRPAITAELRQIGTISIPGAPLESFDVGWIDQASGLYLLADRSNKAIDVIDIKKHAFVGRILGMAGRVTKGDGTCCNIDASGPNGVLTINRKEAWVGDGDGTVKVIDLMSFKIVDTIKTGGNLRADALSYDPANQVVAIASGADDRPFLTFISAKPGHKILGNLFFDDNWDRIEQTQYNPEDGLFYANIPEISKDLTKGAVAVIDPKTRKLVKTIPVNDCAPHGLAIGTQGKLFLGCNAGNPRLGLPPKLLVVDIKSNKTVAEIPGVGGSDQAAVNNRIGHFYAALNGNPEGPIMAVVDAKTNTLLQKVPTGPGAHSVAVSEVNHQVFVPIAATNGGCGCIAVYGAE